MNYSKKEILKNIKKAKHEIRREVFKSFNIFNGIEVSILSDIPSKGSGLASSSALTNALILACSKYKNLELTQYQIAEKSVNIEIKKLKKPIGIQDQFGTAIGGIKIIKMSKDNINIKKINNKKLKNIIENNSIILDTRKKRKAEEVLLNQKKNLNINKLYLNEIRILSEKFINNIQNFNIELLIKELNHSWDIKKKLDKKISNRLIDNKINYLRKNNFEGFKLCGAGKGGFIFAISKKIIKKKEYTDKNIKRIKLDKKGVETIYEKKI